jgi:WD40 repeat protein
MPSIKPSSKRILDPKSLQQWQAQLDDHVNSLAWSPDGKWLAVASVSGPITIFAGKTGQVFHFIGRNLDRVQLNEGFCSCLA